MEIERKFLVKKLPESLGQYKKREIEQAHDHKIHAYKINVAANSREKFVLGKDKYQISDDGDNEGKLQIRNRLRDALA